MHSCLYIAILYYLMYCTHYIPSVLICICTINKDYYYCSIDKLATNNINNVISENLDKVNVWMNLNKLVLNSKKTKYMLFHKHNKTLPNLKLSINGRTVDQATRFNFLCLYLNSQLSWHTHIEDISKKNSGVTGMTYKIQNILPSTKNLSLYNTLILPHINYCILSWCKENDAIILL